MKPYSLPIHLLRQFLFCPRIPFLQEVMGVTPPKPIWVGQGGEYHEKESRLSKRRILTRFGLENAERVWKQTLKSERLGLHGIADELLLGESEVVPVEYKMRPGKPQLGHLLQLCAYGVAAEEHYKLPCHRGFMLFGIKGKVQEVQIDTALRQKLVTYVQALQDSLEGATLPNSSAKEEKCGQCEYENFCADRF